jgi:hypothetical protein
MAEEQHSQKKKMLYILLAISMVVIVALGLLFWWISSQKNAIDTDSSRPEAACHTLPPNASKTGFYDIPCQVTVTMIQYDQSGSERSRLQDIIKSFDAAIRDDSQPDIGVYYLDVAPGTEDEIIKYLKSQKGVDSASRQGGCTFKCQGPN